MIKIKTGIYLIRIYCSPGSISQVTLLTFFYGVLRFEHCYQDEDLMKQIGKIADKTHALTMEQVTLGRYRSLLELFTFNAQS